MAHEDIQVNEPPCTPALQNYGPLLLKLADITQEPQYTSELFFFYFVKMMRSKPISSLD